MAMAMTEQDLISLIEEIIEEKIKKKKTADSYRKA